MPRWYKSVEDRPPPPSRVAIATITAEKFEIYRYVAPAGDPIPVGDLPFLVDYSVPKDEDITWALRMHCLNLLGGPSGMRAEHLRQWLIAATR